MKALQPVAVTDAMFVSSSVAETDYAAWSVGTTYELAARVIKAHRIFESLIAGNVGHDPVDPTTTQWMDIGPTNRWAMLDGLPGSATTATGSIAVTLEPGAVAALAVVDAVADTVRVQIAPDYDVTQDVDDRSVVTFLDLPADPDAEIVVTITGTGTVSVGILLLGDFTDLGLTEASPTIGIQDFSKRDTNEFGVTTVVERTWAKTMTLRTRLDTAEVDAVQRALARFRAKPVLWLGEEGYDSLSIYGFFKSFSIDIALPTISYCSLTVEGLAG